MPSQLPDLTPRELESYGFARAKDIAFDAVQRLWRRRQAEGLKQTDLATSIGWDPAIVSRKLQGPSNWTLRTLGAFVEGLRGELQIRICAVEDPLNSCINYHAYAGYELPDTPLTGPATEVGKMTKQDRSHAIVSMATT